MMQDDERPIDREAWRSVLARGASEPPRATDERIRAAARRALAPHTQRWWLPASLAASLLLAVLIVQWQYERGVAPEAVTESDVAPAASRDAATMAAPAAPAEPAPAAPAADAAQRPAAATSPESFVPPPAVELPAVPVPAAAGKTAPRQTSERGAQARGAPAEAAPASAAGAGSTPVTGIGAAPAPRAQEAAAATPRTPEQWYADIEALRAAGREEEARAELARLEAAYPGWLERHLGERR